MFCRNCGKEINDNAVVCIHCGAASIPKMTCNYHEAKKVFCRNCGKEISENAIVCIHCGFGASNKVTADVNPNAKSKLVAGLLGIFLGCCGAHNFYLGFTGKAIAQLLLTLLTCGIGAIPVFIWSLIESIQILSGNINTDAEGYPLKNI